MTTSLCNFVACERVDDDTYFSLINVRYRRPEPPETIEFWLDMLNISEAELGVKLEIYRGRSLVDFTEEEFVPPGCANVQAKFVLNTADLERKSYTVVTVVNGFAAGKLDLDFGANDGLKKEKSPASSRQRFPQHARRVMASGRKSARRT